MVAAVRIRSCTPAELPELIALLDAEFISSRGRSLSLARRLPGALEAANCPNILLACADDAILASITVKRFDWVTPERTWRGAMIGLVYTRPQARGQGHASRLLRQAAEDLRADGTAFAVLFTAQPEFYRRLGWANADCGLFGTCASAGGAAAGCRSGDAATIERLRRADAKPYMPRTGASYDALPLPADRLVRRASPAGDAYAIYGLHGDSAYVYEFGGAPSGFPALWQDVCSAARSVHVNARGESAGHQWLAAHAELAWREQALAMWLPLAEPACARHFGDWYVPYLDRI